MRIGIVGARVAGSYAGILLSRLGHEVILFDHSVEREKPCGGGVTYKALRSMQWFHEHPLPHTEISAIRLTTPDGYCSDLRLPHPIYVFSRLNLDSHLRQWAMESGAQFRSERVLGISGDKNCWAIETGSGATEVEYVIGADGANSVVRSALSGQYAAGDLSLAVGYSLPGLYDPGTLLIHFQESGFYGYLWSFPRVDHSSVGVFQWLPGANAPDLRRRVEEFIAAHYPGAGSERRFYAARIPTLSRRSLIKQQVCGHSWALLGDAAGFTDSITAEGIYYALRSAELLAQSFRKGDPAAYENAWRSDFMETLESAAAWKDRFYGSMVLSKTFIRRSLQSVRYSVTVRGLLDELISGSLNCGSLFRNLIFKSPNILLQVFRTRALRQGSRRTADNSPAQV